MTKKAIQRTLGETTNFAHRQALLKELWRLEQELDEDPDAEQVSPSSTVQEPSDRVPEVSGTAQGG